MNTYIKILALSSLILCSFLIAKPFLLLIIWSIIVAVALYPFYEKILNLFKGKRKGLITTLFIGVILSIIIVPSISMSNTVIDSTSVMVEEFKQGEIKIQPPNASVKEWPLIGAKLYEVWTKASKDMEAFIGAYPEEIKNSLGWFFASFTGLLTSILLSIVALIIAGVFMSSAQSGYNEAVRFANKLTNNQGKDFTHMCINTIRSVVKGILLVAIIQAILSFVGFSVMGLSTAGILAIVVLLFAIIQVPVTLVMIPIIIYVFSIADTTPAIIFAIYGIVVSLLDNFLKPMLLAKGLETPMIVILIGALGGMVMFGILGLFVGPVILAVAHRVYIKWVSMA